MSCTIFPNPASSILILSTQRYSSCKRPDLCAFLEALGSFLVLCLWSDSLYMCKHCVVYLSLEPSGTPWKQKHLCFIICEAEPSSKRLWEMRSKLHTRFQLHAPFCQRLKSPWKPASLSPIYYHAATSLPSMYFVYYVTILLLYPG